jgi:hypothetical protein
MVCLNRFFPLDQQFTFRYVASRLEQLVKYRGSAQSQFLPGRRFAAEGRGRRWVRWNGFGDAFWFYLV